MATQTTGNLPTQTKTFYNRTLLEAAKPTLLHNKWAQKVPIPKNEGQTVQFRRPELLATKTTPLVEGVTPPGTDLSYTTVTATPLQYGDFTVVSDVLTWTSIDRVLTQAAEELGTQAGETLDEVTRDVLVAGTTVRYAAGRASRVLVQSGDTINGIELRKLRRTLRKNKAKPAEGAFYVLIVGPDTMYDLQTLPEWQAKVENSTPSELDSGIVQRVWGFKIYETEKSKVFTGAGASSIDVHASVAIGKNAYGVTYIDGHAMETITHRAGEAGSADPLDQRNTMGWKATHAAVRLNELFMARLEHAVTS